MDAFSDGSSTLPASTKIPCILAQLLEQNTRYFSFFGHFPILVDILSADPHLLKSEVTHKSQDFSAEHSCKESNQVDHLKAVALYRLHKSTDCLVV